MGKHGGVVQMAAKGANRKAGSRHMRRAVEKMKLADLKKALRKKGVIE